MSTKNNVSTNKRIINKETEIIKWNQIDTLEVKKYNKWNKKIYNIELRAQHWIKGSTEERIS